MRRRATAPGLRGAEKVSSPDSFAHDPGNRRATSHDDCHDYTHKEPMSRRRISTLDLDEVEQQHVRNALQLLRRELGGWEHLAKLLKFEETTIIKVGNNQRTATASMAFRIARLVDVSVDELLTGRFPLRGCPRCGYDPRCAQDNERLLASSKPNLKINKATNGL